MLRFLSAKSTHPDEVWFGSAKVSFNLEYSFNAKNILIGNLATLQLSPSYIKDHYQQYIDHII